MSASHFHLANLIAIIDRNCLQYDGFCSDIMDLEDFTAKWESFGWMVTETNGHDIQELYDAFSSCTGSAEGKPHVIIARTIKGNGISFMENNAAWHHSRLSQKQYDSALAELRGEKECPR